MANNIQTASALNPINRTISCENCMVFVMTLLVLVKSCFRSWPPVCTRTDSTVVKSCSWPCGPGQTRYLVQPGELAGAPRPAALVGAGAAHSGAGKNHLCPLTENLSNCRD